MPIVGMDELAGHLRREVARDPLEHERERARVLQRVSVGDEPLAVRRAPRLHLHAAEGVDRLGRQPEVAHHRDARAG